jgi:N-acetylneuraminic acid mutarotase
MATTILDHRGTNSAEVGVQTGLGVETMNSVDRVPPAPSKYCGVGLLSIVLLALANATPMLGQTFPANDAQAGTAGAQIPAVTHNTWTSGAPMPTALAGSAAAVLEGQIYVVGGSNNTAAVADTQVFDPATNVWTTGVPLPAPLSDAAAAVVNNVLYVIGGYGSDASGGSPPTNTVWAYHPKTKKWSEKAAMLTARDVAAAVVANNIIYVIGGWNGVFSGNGLATVESYDPATDTWTEENPLLVGKWAPSAGVFGTELTGYTIVAPDGAAQCCPSDFTGDNESYNVSTNTWTSLNPDPTARGFACFGSIGSQLYVAGGTDTQGPALSVTESYQLSENAWKTLDPIPQATISPGSAVYKGRLYCFGGWSAWNGSVLDSVQIYQP